MDGLAQEDERRISVLRAVQACQAFVEIFRPLGLGTVKMSEHRADLAIAEIEELAILLKQTGIALRDLCHD